MASPFVELEVGERVVKLTNPDKVLFPMARKTKRDLAEYYLAVGEGVVRALYERPTQLRRFPDGVDGEVIVLKTIEDVNRWVTKIAGSRDAGELTVECEYVKTQFATLISRQLEAAETWTSTLPDGTTIVCSGLIKNVSNLNQDTDGAIIYTVGIPLSGEPTVTAAA